VVVTGPGDPPGSRSRRTGGNGAALAGSARVPQEALGVRRRQPGPPGSPRGRQPARQPPSPPKNAGLPGMDRPAHTPDASLAKGSRWDATIVASDPAGTETGRRRFVFALDAAGVSDGRAVPPIDPALLLAVLLLALGIAGLAFGLAGGVLPRTLPDASRPALLGASTVGALLGLAIIVVAGPR